MPSSKLLLQVGLGARSRAAWSSRPAVRFFAGPLGALGADYRVFDKGPAFVMLTSRLPFRRADAHRQ